MMGVAPVEPSAKCDRCGHALYRHASAAFGTICMVGRKGGERLCPCDGFVAKESA
jgi:hypothetical protein